MFKKILIVNRGEIAVRIIRACRELGIQSAALFSRPDAAALHTRMADESYLIGEALPADSYLNIPKIIALAKEIGADAIHPGYGFLSERAAFIAAVEGEGITFIGPSSKSVEMMGSKIAARSLMMQYDVPVVPGTAEPVRSFDEALPVAENIGFPVLIKASAGGGGKGMRKVASASELREAIDSAGREALKAFGDAAVYIEKFIDNPKHIEVQILADQHGNYAHVFERECSVQRRHQKIVEEAPSSYVDEATRQKITHAAIQAAKACQYTNAGTIEFLMDANRNFYFLEMNTRLQVEHPVTEMISGIDLVKEQISIAAGNPLSFRQEDLTIRGHAIEARVYAEDPDNNFLPTTGIVEYHRRPSGPGVRVDEGIDVGSPVTMFYDPLLSKITGYGRDREEATARLKRALAEYHIAGIQTNLPLLIWVLRNKTFLSGNYSIAMIEEEFLPLLPGKWRQTDDLDAEKASALLHTLLRHDRTTKLTAVSVRRKQSKEWREQYYE